MAIHIQKLTFFQSNFQIFPKMAFEASILVLRHTHIPDSSGSKAIFQEPLKVPAYLL
jgi:hypothetical protein